jgi:hypothetical protein
MFIVWKSGQDVVRGGEAAEQHCHNCNRDCPHSVMVKYAYTNFYWILGFVSGYEYFVACDRCNAAVQISAAEARLMAPSVPVPFMRRFGCLMAILIIVGIALLSTLAKK